MRTSAAVLVAAVLVAGCGPSSYRDYRDQLAKRWCDRAVRCGLVGASERVRCPVSPLIELGPGAVDPGAEIRAGHLAFRSDGAQECLDAVKGAPCDAAQAALALGRHCHDVVAPNVATGGACVDSSECIGGYCVETQAGCGGTCKAYPAPGAACAPDGPPDLTCDATVQFCDGSVCRRHLQSGDRCNGNAECAFPLVCFESKCQELPRRDDGAACDASSPPCRDGRYCNGSGVCAKRPGEGAACDTPDACQDGLACQAGVCARWADVGGPCSGGTAGACPASQACMNGACAAVAGPTGVGQACMTDGDCYAALYCQLGTCQYRSGAMGPCSQDNAACVSGLACDADHQLCRASLTCPAR